MGMAEKRQVAGRERFVVRTECVNHPLFRVLLEEAEEEFGYTSAGPLELPCDAKAFAGVLEQIEEEKQMAARRNSYWLLGSGRLVIVDRSSMHSIGWWPS